MAGKRYQPWTGTLRLDDKDAETLVWLSRKMGQNKLRGMAFSEVIRFSLRNERLRVEEAEQKGKSNA